MNSNHEMQCNNCNTCITPLWRRGIDGKYLCNACGLYFKIHNVNRPHSMKSESFRHRQRMRKTFSFSTYQNAIMEGYFHAEKANRKFSRYEVDYILRKEAYKNNYVVKTVVDTMEECEKRAAEALVMLSQTK